MSRTISLPLLLAFAAAGCANGAAPAGHAEHHEAATAKEPAPSSTPAPAVAAHESKKIAPSANYPLTKCVVTGEDLAAMGDRIAYSYDGTEVQFCCPDCIGEFKKDPEKYLAQIRAATK